MENNKSLEIGLIDFDADLPPNNPINIEAARVRELEYDSVEEAYVDGDGCLIRDKFGQLF